MQTERKHHIDGLLVLLLFGVFATCILSVLLTGADAYRRLAERDDESYSRRTAAQYITTKVRQAVDAEAVSVESFGASDALVLTEEIDGYVYITRIYYYDGYIRELFSDAEVDMMPEDGEQVLPTQGMTLSLENDLLSVQLTDANGHTTALTLALRGGEGAAA